MIEFWFDFASPYAYFASLDVESLAARHGRRVLWRPFMLGAVFRITGSEAFSRAPMRGEYGARDWARIARMYGVPFALAEYHPFNAVHPARTHYWLESQDSAMAAAFCRRAFRAYYQDGLDLRDGAVVADLAAAVGADRDQALQAQTAPEMKERYRQVTEEATARKIFGSPFFIVDGEPFWGWDRMTMLDRWLQTGGW